MFVQAIAYNQPRTTIATIGAGASLSEAVTLPPGHVLCGIQMPADWTAAAITLQGSADNATFQDVYVAAGTEHSITAAAATTIALDPTLYRSFPYLKVRSGTGASAVNQAAARSIALISRPL